MSDLFKLFVFVCLFFHNYSSIIVNLSYDTVSLHFGLLHLQEYKPPCSKDIPIDFRVSLLKNAPNPLGVLRSKGTVVSYIT